MIHFIVKAHMKNYYLYVMAVENNVETYDAKPVFS